MLLLPVLLRQNAAFCFQLPEGRLCYSQPFHAQFKALLRVDFLGGGADTGALPFPLPELEVAMSTTELAPSDWIQGASSASSSRSGSGSSKDGSHKCCGNFGKE
ncbi:uncharacterized protein LOC21410520 [Morus notabilis]|uniref:uncharacterized protein LOC21410520 n=1 Tax=Morus notabilis TaxID=981085 RepID=UPI000CED526E|nr:uncharacterized protein LOC21410520 [Morus notabilis]